MSDIKTASLKKIREMKNSGQLTTTDESVRNFDLSEEFWENLEPVEPRNKKSVHLRVDPDVLEFFKSEGRGHLTRMNAVLRSYVEARKKNNTPS